MSLKPLGNNFLDLKDVFSVHNLFIIEGKSERDFLEFSAANLALK